MQNKVSINTNIGMLRDRSISKVDNQFAYENHNIRITARNKDTLLSVTNERGNVLIEFTESGNDVGLSADTIRGILIGYAVLNKYLVLFTTGNEDFIYRVEYNNTDNKWYLRLLYEGDLGFDIEHPIETIPLFETEDVQKVYWVDGKNQPRVINIKRNYYNATTGEFLKNTIFDFVTDYNHSESSDLRVSIEKQHLGMGSFPAGNIQYLCTYYNKYGQETNPVYISPIYYISPEDRGGNPETTYTCSFKITLKNADNDFEYVKIYALLRTSEYGTPISYIVGTLRIDKQDLSIVDSGQGDNIPIDPTILLYVGGREVVAGTFSHKDNTLFLGDLKFKSSERDIDIEIAIKDTKMYGNNNDSFASNCIAWNSELSESSVPYYENNGLYPYESQLNSSSDKITGFKGGEKYRFAIQFITPTGQKSRAFFIGDSVNPSYPRIENGLIKRSLPRVFVPQLVVDAAISAGYRHAVLLMAEASDGDRAIVAQGIVNPTVFNLGQRNTNAPYAISSWYMRPRNSKINSRHLESVNNVSGVVTEDGKVTRANVSFCEIQNIQPEINAYYNESSFNDTLTKIAYMATSKFEGLAYIVKLYAVYMFNNGSTDSWKVSNSPDSATATFFNSSSLSTLENDKALVDTRIFPFVAEDRDSDYLEMQRLFTSAGISIDDMPTRAEIFHHDYGQTNKHSTIIDVGIADSSTQSYYSRINSEQFYIDENIVTFNTPDIEKLQSSSWEGLKFRIIGIAEVTSNITDYSVQTTTGLSNSASIYKLDLNHTNSENIEGLVSYPLLYDTSLVYDGTHTKYDENGGRTGTKYFNIFPFHKEGSITHNEYLEGTIKYSEIEKKTFANLRYCYSTKYLWVNGQEWKPENKMTISATSGSQSNQFKQLVVENKSYIYQGTYDYLSTTGTKEFGIYAYSGDNTNLSENIVKNSTSDYIVGSTEPVRIQFQSLPHVVMKFGKVGSKDEILPQLSNEQAFSLPSGVYLPWENSEAYDTYQKSINYSTNLPYYFIGELYKDVAGSDDRYGGNSKSALNNNKFIPISNRYKLGSDLVMVGTQGDTYFQRWDCLKTEPYSDESKNGIVDITSFMVETHTNIEGRYDARRGFLKNVTTSRENSNLINNVYSTPNNFFSSSVLDDKYYLAEFRNQVTWTKTKSLAEDVDTWTNVTTANTLDLDGDKGPVRAIRRFNNALIAFQDKGISEILFNSRTQLSTTSGIPIEIANSGKVDGKRYISEKAGCVNKWSIVEAKTGIYFIDNINKNINVFSQGLQDLSSARGFGAWVRSINTLTPWNPLNFNNFISFYDSIHGDIYFVRSLPSDTVEDGELNGQGCLVFNEMLSQFTSFFDYGDVNMMVNIGDRFISYKNESLWLQNEGEYNNLFGELRPYSIKYRICPDPYGDKTFNNIEYRADIMLAGSDEEDDTITGLTEKTFNTLRVYNEYQSASVDLVFNEARVSNLKRKFRIWRADIPRDANDKRGLNRIRNPWVYIELAKDAGLADERMEFHDLLVKYYE